MDANEFPDSTWIMNRTELAAATALPPPDGVLSGTFAVYKSAKTESIGADYDVFGDGSVVKNSHARLIAQHDPQEFAMLPKAPAFLD